MKDILKEKAEEASQNMAFQIDRYVKLHIKPKPKYLPHFIWRKILTRLLVLEEFQK
jgi:hypothetical protein